MAKKSSKDLAKYESPRLLSPFNEVERWFEEMFRRPFSMLEPSWWPKIKFPAVEECSPSVDIYKEGNNVIVKAEIPGMKKADLDVSLSEGALTISGQKKKEEKVNKNDYYRYECSEGSFSRTFSLPEGVQTDKAKAKFDNGVLEITIPMTAAPKKKEQKIKVQ